MYVGNDFPDASPNETKRPFSFDFSNDLPAGDNIASVVWTVSVKADSPVVDPTPSSRLVGAPSSANQQTTQNLGNMVAGCVYVITCVATSVAGVTAELYSHQRCLAPA